MDKTDNILCEPLAAYSRSCRVQSLFPDEKVITNDNDIKVIELFAGVGGFRIGLERASKRFKTIWNNQWEPSTKKQDASIVYCQRFGIQGHSNEDIATVPTDEIPDADLLVGGFPCQDYSVATTLKRSGGIEGKKGVLWWQIHRILRDHANPPSYLMLENVDRLLGSPATQRGRDFAIILASLSDLGYNVEWRVINAAEYGMPQRRRRTYIFAFKNGSAVSEAVSNPTDWLLSKGIMVNAFPISEENSPVSCFKIEGELDYISANFNKGKALSPFKNAGIMMNRVVYTCQTKPDYNGEFVTLGDVLVPEIDVPDAFFIPDGQLDGWKYAKGGKSEKRVNKASGYEYNYSEGAMAFPDSLDKPSRTIITGEGGAAVSRFKHVVQTPSGRYRRLVPIELERLNMFPDNHTFGATDSRRAFLMGNALVTGIVERIGLQLLKYLKA
jgi:DNA (cytosine-5)-methyltransferase 1